MTHLRLLGPHDGPVTPMIGCQHSYRAPTAGYTVTLPPLVGISDGVRLAVQRWTRDTGRAVVTIATAVGDVFSDDSTTVPLVNPGDLYLLEAMTVSGARSWLVVDIQTAGRPVTTVTDNGDGTASIG